MSWGDTFKNAWESAKSGAKATATALVNGATATGEAIADGAKWTYEKGAEGAKWVDEQAQKAADATVAGAKWAYDKGVEGAKWVDEQAQKAIDATVAGATWAYDKGVEGAKWVDEQAQKAIDATVEGAKWLGDKIASGTKWLAEGIWQSFTGGPKAFVCLPCKLPPWLYKRTFEDYQARQLRVCTDEDGKQTVEEVQRNPDGTYTVIGEIKGNPPTTGDVWNTPTPVTPYTVPAPSVSHVNGIDNTPSEGLSGAMALQQEIHKQCPGKASGDACDECDCVLYTYSEELGFVSDLAQCVAGKFGWEGKVGEKQAQMMRDAIANGDHITMSAHSRGSILTEDSWNQVFSEQRSEFMNSPEAVAAGQEAYDMTLAETMDPISALMVSRIAQQQVAGEQAAEVVNKHVTVVSSGNAVSFYNPHEEGIRVVSTWHGVSVDKINVFTGSTHFGQMKTVRKEIPRGSWLAPLGMNHNFNEYYAATVAAQFCSQ